MDEVILKNPITNRIQNSINASKHKLNFAVPFLNSFVTTILNDGNTKSKSDKRLLTRFDETCIISFEIPTLLKLLDLGFKIRYDNNIHLKLYITDNETFVTSSNLTKGGFENNVELTIKVDSANSGKCNEIFDEIWHNANDNELTYEILTANLSKYNLLKKRDESRNDKRLEVEMNIGGIDTQEIIKEIFNQKKDYSRILNFTFEASHVKEKFKNKLKMGFNKEFFYVQEGYESRRDNLFYDFVYGYESNIAGTGLRELQFKTAFEHQEFKSVIEYIYPEIINMKPWNLRDKDEFRELCCGIFDYKIPQYTESLPIRIVSYFYPDYFLPIFKLDHLKKISEALGIETNAKSKGEKLYAYTTFIADKMQHLPYDNNIKSNIAYHLLFTVELRNRLLKGERYENILLDYKQNWKRQYIYNGMEILKKIDIIK